MSKGTAIIPTAPARMRNRDSDYLYRFDSYFYYLTGFAEPEAVLVLLAGEEPKSILFCRERSPERELWDGVRHGPEGAKEVFGFDEAYPIQALDETMPKLLANQPALYYAPGADAGWDARVMGWLNQVRSQARARNGPSVSAWNARDTTATRSTCAFNAATSVAWPWPNEAAEYAASMSR